MAKNYYTVLGVLPGATPTQIRDRFRQLARERHPDRFHGRKKQEAEIEFQAITEAFNILSNAELRRQHDADLARPVAGPSQGVDPKQVARVYLQRGVRAFREKNFQAAVESFERATREDSGNALAWHHLARSLHQRGFLSRAAAAIVKACEIEPMNAPYLKLAGQLHAEAGYPSKAEHFFRECLKWGGGEDAEVREELDKLKGSRRGFFGRS